MNGGMGPLQLQYHQYNHKYLIYGFPSVDIPDSPIFIDNVSIFSPTIFSGFFPQPAANFLKACRWHLQDFAQFFALDLVRKMEGVTGT